MSDISAEILAQVFLNLNGEDFGRCGRVCKYWASLSADDYVWKKMFLQEFEGCEFSCNSNYKEHYIDCIKRLKSKKLRILLKPATFLNSQTSFEISGDLFVYIKKPTQVFSLRVWFLDGNGHYAADSLIAGGHLPAGRHRFKFMLAFNSSSSLIPLAYDNCFKVNATLYKKPLGMFSRDPISVWTPLKIFSRAHQASALEWHRVWNSPKNHPITVKCSVDRRSVFPHDVVHAHIRIANQTQSHRCFAKFQLRTRFHLADGDTTYTEVSKQEAKIDPPIDVAAGQVLDRVIALRIPSDARFSVPHQIGRSADHSWTEYEIHLKIQTPILGKLRGICEKIMGISMPITVLHKHLKKHGVKKRKEEEKEEDDDGAREESKSVRDVKAFEFD